MREIYRDDLATVYQGDALELELPKRGVFLFTDPPYGIGVKTANTRRGGRDFPPVAGDDRPFDPTPWLGFPRVVLFGANNYADRLPASNGWIVWDKIDGLRSYRQKIGASESFSNAGDAELAWTNAMGAVRIFRHRWQSFLQASEVGERRVHPTQKPVELCARIIRRLSKPADLVVDPYAGSGSISVAAVREGHRTIAVELVPGYADVVAGRLEAEARLRARG